MDVAIIRSLAHTIVTRYGANAGSIAAHAAREAHKAGDLDGAKQWTREHQSIENLEIKGLSPHTVDTVV